MEGGCIGLCVLDVYGGGVHLQLWLVVCVFAEMEENEGWTELGGGAQEAGV